MRGESRTVERQLAVIASGQHGVVTRKQLLDAGLTRAELEHRQRTGVLLVEHRGVYRVGHRAPSLEARYLAAVYACGAEAALSGRAAAHLFGLLKGRAPRPEVTVPRERRVAGVVTHRVRGGATREMTSWRGVPVTTVATTLVDIAGSLTLPALARACHEASVLYRTTPADVLAVLAKRPNAKGAAKLRRVLQGEVRVTLSALERRFLSLLSGAALPLPQTNRLAGGRRVDCRWPDHRLTVELDGYRYHSSRHAWEQDRRREREARARGDEFRRYTYGDVFEDPCLMLAELHALLSRRPAATSREEHKAGKRGI
jgi:very-short-patch-repair endonuclease/phosphoribosylcarboxyaminoimidazole (NCAIR) mutase